MLPVKIGMGRLLIEDVLSVAHNNNGVLLSSEPEFARRIRSGSEFLDRLLANNGIVYGVNTGYGDSCTVTVPPPSCS